MFTRMLQAYLAFIIVLLVIISLVIAVYSHNLLIGIGVFIVGMIAICVLGAFIEMLNNIMDIKQEIAELIAVEKGLVRKLDMDKEHNKGFQQNNAEVIKEKTISKGVSLENAAKSYTPTTWYCANCGTMNAPASRFCKECGNPK